MSTQIGYSGLLNNFSHSLGSRGPGGGGGMEKVTADDNGSVFNTSQFGKQLRCHRFQGSGDNSLYIRTCLLYTSPSPRDGLLSRMPSSA